MVAIYKSMVIILNYLLKALEIVFSLDQPHTAVIDKLKNLKGESRSSTENKDSRHGS